MSAEILQIIQRIPAKRAAQSAFLKKQFNSFAAEPSFIWPDELMPKAKFRVKHAINGIMFRGNTLNDVRLLKNTFDVFRQAKCLAYDCREPKLLCEVFRLKKDTIGMFPSIFDRSPFCRRELNGLAVTIRLLSDRR
jgi:hypothetical protein